MNRLTPAQSDTCTYLGVFGALLSATCLIQHLLIMGDHWIAFVLLGLYVYAIGAFVLLAVLRRFAPLLLVVSAITMFAACLTLILSGVFSLAVILLLIYEAIVVAVLYMGEYPQKLKAQWMAIRDEQKSWEGRL